MTRVIPFRPEHVDVMELREHERAFIHMNRGARGLFEDSVACTGIEDGRIVCCGGVIPHVDGSSDIWLLPSVYVKKYPKVFVKVLKHWLFARREDLALFSMQSECLDDPLHNRWMAFLGFDDMGISENKYLGKDYRKWSRSWE